MLKYAAILSLFLLSANSAQLSATERETVAIIGTGDMGDSIGPKLAEKGYRVIYGSRDPADASVRQLVALIGNNAQATTQQEAAQQADIVVLVVPWPAMEQVGGKAVGISGKDANLMFAKKIPAMHDPLESMV